MGPLLLAQPIDNGRRCRDDLTREAAQLLLLPAALLGGARWRGPLWRFSLKDVGTGERHGFPGLEALVAYLQAETYGAETGSTRAPPGPSGTSNPSGSSVKAEEIPNDTDTYR